MTRRRSETGSRTEELYRAALADFVAVRKALAERLEAAGHGDDARRVAELRKPTLSAWAVNQVFWRHRREFDRLIRAGARLRSVQQGGAAGSEFRGRLEQATSERRRALEDALRRAETILTGGGHAATTATLRRIETTLDALAAGAERSEEPGRLSRDLDAPGFEAALALAAAPAPATTPRKKKQEVAPETGSEARLREAVAAAVSAEEGATRAARERDAAARRVADAETTAERAREMAADTKRTLERLLKQARLAAVEVKKAREEARRAGDAVRRAERKVATAQARVRKLRGRADRSS